MAEETVKCPFCAEIIQKDAKKCRYCGEYLNLDSQKPGIQKDKNRSGFDFFMYTIAIIIIVFVAVLVIGNLIGGFIKD